MKIAHVRNITSKAASLGATSPAAAVVKMSLDHQGGVTCAKVPDGMCMTTSCFFAGSSEFTGIDFVCRH